MSYLIFNPDLSQTSRRGLQAVRPEAVQLTARPGCGGSKSAHLRTPW